MLSQNMPWSLQFAIANKEAETVADAIYNEWFSKFGILAQIHMDGKKYFTTSSLQNFFNL